MTSLDPDDLALIAELDESQRGAHGVPTDAEAARRERAAELALAVLSPWLASDGLRVSVLGAGWSTDVDAHVTGEPDPSAMLAAGWLPLGAVGYPSRWAVVDGDAIVGGVDIVRAPRPDPVVALADRIARRGEVRLREALELRVLTRAGVETRGTSLPDEMRAAAEAVTASPSSGPVKIGSPTRGGSRARRAAGRARAQLQRRRVIALSGVDGSGKSTLARNVAEGLAAAGVPAGVVWARPGMRIGALDKLAQVGRRLLGQGQQPGVRAVASTGAQLPSRKGAIGAIWATLVAAAFFVDVRRQHHRGRGVAVYDRHLLDAMVTLDFVYAGAPLGVARLIARAALPRPMASFYVDVPAEVAVARKPGDAFGEHAVRSQLEGYAARLAGPLGRHIERLDATQAPDALAMHVLRKVLQPK